MYKGYIYRHWIINEDGVEKSYIGQTYQDTPEQRWGVNGRRYLSVKRKNGGNTYFANAILKYGWDNFQHDIIGIVEADTKEQLILDLDEWEIYYIDKYDSYYNGFNETTGGTKGKVHSEESRKKQSEAMKRKYENGYVNPKKGTTMSNKQKDQIRKTLKGKYTSGELINPMQGKHLSQSTKDKISQAQKGRQRTDEEKQQLSEIFSGEGNPMYGKPCSDSRKRKISEALKGKMAGEKHPLYGTKWTEERRIKTLNTMQERYGNNLPCSFKGQKHSEETKKTLSKKAKERNMAGSKNPNAKKIICLNTGEVFNSGIDAANWCNGNSKAITKCCRGNSKTSCKHPETGEPLKWMYYDEYLKLHN